MINLQRYVMIYEGGAGGHMAHPIDYTDFTGQELIELVQDLFGGKITEIKEKLDGMNIMATMNDDGEVVFIRNNSNLNSERGGMSIDDMVEKWAEKEHQKKVFIQAGQIITDIFKKLGKFIDKLFPEGDIKRYAAESGAIKNKLEFCKEAISVMNDYDKLSKEAKTLTEKI